MQSIQSLTAPIFHHSSNMLYERSLIELLISLQERLQEMTPRELL